MFLGSFVKIVVNNVLILRYIFSLDLLYQSEDCNKEFMTSKVKFRCCEKVLSEGVGGITEREKKGVHYDICHERCAFSMVACVTSGLMFDIRLAFDK